MYSRKYSEQVDLWQLLWHHLSVTISCYNWVSLCHPGLNWTKPVVLNVSHSYFKLEDNLDLRAASLECEINQLYS